MPTGFDFADIVDEAVDRAGGETSTAADIVRVRRGLRLLLERWEAQGFNTWRIRTMTAYAPGGVGKIGLPDTVDDILNVSSVRDLDRTYIGDCTQTRGSESPMRRISATQYAQLTNKLTTGSPSQYWLDRQDKPSLHIYPIGPAPLIITFVARPAEFNRFTTDASDVPGRWLEALVTGLALDLARKRPPYNEGLINRLAGEAAKAEDLAQRADRDRGRFKYRIAHGRRG